MRHSSFTNVKIIVNLFQFFTNVIVLLLKHSIKGAELSINQGAHFNLTCFQSSIPVEHSLILYVIDRGEPIQCLVDCNQMNYTQCTRLRLGTSDILCGSGPNCYMEPQCNFIFKSASILLDGLRVRCVDFDVNVEEWDIKGSIFSKIYIYIYIYIHTTNIYKYYVLTLERFVGELMVISLDFNICSNTRIIKKI